MTYVMIHRLCHVINGLCHTSWPMSCFFVLVILLQAYTMLHANYANVMLHGLGHISWCFKHDLHCMPCFLVSFILHGLCHTSWTLSWFVNHTMPIMVYVILHGSWFMSCFVIYVILHGMCCFIAYVMFHHLPNVFFSKFYIEYVVDL